MRVGVSRNVCYEIKCYMYDKGIPQTYICRKTGIPAFRVSETLNAKRPLRLDEFIAICNALGIKPGRLLDNIRIDDSC